MSKPRWSELVAAFGLDQPFNDADPSSPSPASPGAARVARRADHDDEVPTDDDDALLDGTADRDDSFDREDGDREDGDGHPHDEVVADDGTIDEDVVETDPVETDVTETETEEALGTDEPAEADHVLDGLIVDSAERFGALLLSDAAELEALPARQGIRNGSTDGHDRFTDLGTQIARAMRVAYDAVGEMKRLEQEIAALLRMQDSLRETLVEAADELHRSLAGLSLGDQRSNWEA